MDTQAIIRSRDDLARIVGLREKELQNLYLTAAALLDDIESIQAKLARNNVLRQRIEELQAKLARVEKENKRLIDAHLKNTEQHRPAVTLRDRSDLTHVCVWRQRFEAVQARSEAVLKPLQALEQDDD